LKSADDRAVAAEATAQQWQALAQSTLADLDRVAKVSVRIESSGERAALPDAAIAAECGAAMPLRDPLISRAARDPLSARAALGMAIERVEKRVAKSDALARRSAHVAATMAHAARAVEAAPEAAAQAVELSAVAAALAMAHEEAALARQKVAASHIEYAAKREAWCSAIAKLEDDVR
jgi:hypothetical protein